MRPIPRIIALVLASAFLAFGQPGPVPDFSGNWVLNPEKSTLAKDYATKSETIVIENKKSMIVFQYKTDGKKSTEKYTPDGQERVATNLGSSQLMSKAHWQDGALVIESRLQIGVPNTVVTVSGLKPVIDRWTLSSDGRTLSHDTADTKEIRVYDKQ